MDDLISVIVPIYNVEEYLSKCIDSIIHQTYENLEIILIDDGSLDNSGNICDKYAQNDKRIQVIHKKNGGLSDARNVGISKASGRYITLIDSDDYVLEDYVDFLYKLLKEKNADMSVCKQKVIYENGGEIYTGTNKEYILTPKETLRMALYSNDFDISAWGKLYKKELFDKVKYPVGRLYEDAATTYKLIDLCKKIAFKSEEKYVYFVRNNSITTKNFNPKKMDLITSTKEMTDFVSNKYPDLTMAANRRLMYAYLSTLMQLTSADKNIVDYKKYKNILMDYIKEHRKEILKDKEVPKRDRMALYSLKFGFLGFKINWNIYKKITKRV